MLPTSLQFPESSFFCPSCRRQHFLSPGIFPDLCNLPKMMEWLCNDNILLHYQPWMHPINCQQHISINIIVTILLVACFIFSSWHRSRLILPAKSAKKSDIPSFSLSFLTNLPTSFCSSCSKAHIFLIRKKWAQHSTSPWEQHSNCIRTHNTLQKSLKLLVPHSAAFWSPKNQDLQS